VRPSVLVRRGMAGRSSSTTYGGKVFLLTRSPRSKKRALAMGQEGASRSTHSVNRRSFRGRTRAGRDHVQQSMFSISIHRRAPRSRSRRYWKCVANFLRPGADRCTTSSSDPDRRTKHSRVRPSRQVFAGRRKKADATSCTEGVNIGSKCVR